MNSVTKDVENVRDQFSSNIIELLRFLQNYNMKQTEQCLHREYNRHLNKSSVNVDNHIVKNVINVNDYFTVYSYLSNFINNSPYKIELVQFLFPLFVHFYLDLIEHNSLNECQKFFNQFVHSTFQSLHSEYFYQLKLISSSSKHIYQSPLINTFRSSRFFLRLSMTSCTQLQHFIDQTKLNSTNCITPSQISLLLSIFHQYIKIDINQQNFSPTNVVRFCTIEQPMTPIFVHTSIANTIQFTRLHTGPFSTQAFESNQTLQHSQLNKQDTSLLYPQINYNRPVNHIDLNNIPRLGPHQLPSICLLTLKHDKYQINCVVLSNDCRYIAIGFQTSEILIHALNPDDKLYAMKSANELRCQLSHSNINYIQENLLNTTLCSNIANERLLIGHTSSIYALAFAPTKQTYLLSGSHDCTIRLWHLSIWTCLVVYKMHSQPILDLKFASIGQIFASCAIDGLICLWTIDKISPLRIYPEYGHSGPINLVEFHPNANYLASAHYDHTVHLWNINNNNNNPLVRIFNGHRHQISSMKFSPNGFFLATGCWNGEIILWDIQNNLQIAHLHLHREAISSIEFSPLTGTLLLVSSIDSSISLWNCFLITKLYDEKLTDSINVNLSPNKILFNVFKTKNTPIYNIRFSKENILYAVGLKNQ